MAWLFYLASMCLGQSTELAVQETLRVDYVLIDLLVLDKKNQPISGLTKNDFVVKENGKAVNLDTFEITDFTQFVAEPVQIDRKSGDREAIAVPVSNRQQFIFALDQESLYLTEIRKSFSQLRRSLAKSNLPENADYLLYSMESGVLTPGFVSNLSHFLGELNLFEDRLTKRYAGEIERKNQAREKGNRRGAGRPSGGNRKLLELDDLLKDCLKDINTNSSARLRAAAARCVSDVTESFVEDEEYRVLRVLGELEALAYRFEIGTGQKRIFFVSPGFSLSPGMPGVELANYLITSTFRNGLHQRGGGSQIAETMMLPQPSSFRKEFQKVVHACTRNRVVFHSLDIFTNAQENSNDLAVTTMKPNQLDEVRRIHKSYLRQNSGGLERLATTSGGFYSRSPSLQKTITLWMPRLQYSYLLGYLSPDGKPGKYRKIKIKCKRKGTSLHYRRGYYSANGS